MRIKNKTKIKSTLPDFQMRPHNHTGNKSFDSMRSAWFWVHSITPNAIVLHCHLNYLITFPLLEGFSICPDWCQTECELKTLCVGKTYFWSFFLSFFLFFFFFFFFVVVVRAGEGRAERKRDNPKQAPCCQRRAWSRAPSHKPWDHDLSWNQEFGPLTDCHPSTLENTFLYPLMSIMG